MGLFVPRVRQSRKGFKLKSKTKEQKAELRKFFAENRERKWTKDTIFELARRIKLDFKSTNKWLWDHRNRAERKKEEQPQ